ncbi:NADPH-dependent 7-cyano-7-deazaguanine reductase [Geodia barretti]|uniref:NADPH-dependent 7-cyano-7-deazaguanine reductase n=1 Tax=Geodia barretti TaxID=519541 RepID=A0AA35SAB6_GEOBA|nr:NADPH-dependent 7-cyano-7-deazaguanine reductase [Geodia barretti]
MAKVLDFQPHADDDGDRDFSESAAWAGFRNRDQLPGVHLGVPETGLPDFGEIRVTYVPGEQCIELKSLKYYLIEFRNRGIFYEAVTNEILDDLVAACQPRRMTVVGDFALRGGIKTVVTASYEARQ